VRSAGEPGSTPRTLWQAGRYCLVFAQQWMDETRGKAKAVERIRAVRYAGERVTVVADWYGEKYYQAAGRQNPAGPLSGTLRTFRGSRGDASRAERRDHRAGNRGPRSAGSLTASGRRSVDVRLARLHCAHPRSRSRGKYRGFLQGATRERSHCRKGIAAESYRPSYRDPEP
jgi:hypothetical protein